MVALIKIAFQLLADVVGFAVLRFWPARLVQAENLFLRRQLALFKERRIRPRRMHAVTQKATLAVAESVEPVDFGIL